MAIRRRRPKIGLEKGFICFTIAAIVAVSLISYVSLYMGNDDAYQSTNRLPLRPRDGAHQRTHRDGVDGSTSRMSSSRAGEMYHQEDSLENSNLIIPSIFTAVDEQWLHNGRVVREFSHRVLSRSISQSNVVVVSPGWNKTHVFTGKAHGDSTGRYYADHSYPAKIAIEQGHTTHLLPTSTLLDEGWHTALGHRYDSASVGWILLAYFSTQNSEASAQHPTSPTIDGILSPSRAGAWLQHTTVTYLVFPMSARATIPLTSISGQHHDYEMDYTVNQSVEVTGLTAAKTLLDSNYKLQLLASSHSFDAPNGGVDADKYGPNSLFTSVESVHRFMYEGATTALRKEEKHIRQNQQQGPSEKLLEVKFHTLIFATQGLDLAIPSRFSYTDVGSHRECTDNLGVRKERCDPKLNARAFNQTIFLHCPKRHDLLNVQFIDRKDISNIDVVGMPPNANAKYANRIRMRRVGERTQLERSYGVMIDLNDSWMKPYDERTGEIEIWSGSEDPDLSEAVCVKSDKSSIQPKVDCKTRIIPTTAKSVSTHANKQLSNLLIIMIDPLSWQQLRRSLPNTWAMLELFGFVEFHHYTAVGNNSGPNQAALYSGETLEGRQGIRASKNSRRKWLWDRLNDASYVTMKAEDGCISNSNMVQSMKPNTHHGQQLHNLFCQSFDRPNCLGGKLAAEHLVEYAKQFIHTYNRIDGKPSAHASPWAAFVSFVDSHEDSSTLISYIDGLLVDFLQDIPMDNTLILFTSDHGLHYGPALTTKAGQMERAQPTLFVRMPSFQNLTTLKQNANKFTTAFDVHETILDVLLGKAENPSMVENKLGMSLLKKLPKSRLRCAATHAIPSQFCSLVDAESKPSTPQHRCDFMRDPPSIFSFYSDIPKSNRPQWPRKCPVSRDHSLDNTARCFCATNERDWFNCSNMPRKDFRSSRLNTEQFSLRSCRHHDLDKSLELDIHVTKNDQVASERKNLVEQTVKHLKDTRREVDIRASLDAQPNIIFLEIDSVSLSFSERFFPKTWELLQHHSIKADQDGISCPTGWCAGAFNKTSVVGQSSIVNQLAALSGCLQYDDKVEELKHYRNNDGSPSYCPGRTSGRTSLGEDPKTKISRNQWIFDAAKNLGYITFFGEEFCYEQSPYVVQTQSAFTLDVDLSLSELYCHLAKDWLKVNGKVNSGLPTYGIEYDGKDVPNACFDGKSRGEIGLEYIAQMWDAYSEQPKFTFLNALAAHDYNLKASHAPLGAENYDITVYDFLSSIMARNDSRETYIVLRGDHGLQGGPYPIDYATQIEHLHPFTAIIAPAKSAVLSINSFASNQNKLVTGFDLYHSIRYLMSPFLAKDKQESLLVDAGIPPWSYNLFRQTVPPGRNCQDAKIPEEFCPCTSERMDMMPSFYVGHSEQSERLFPIPELRYDWELRRFAARRQSGIMLPKVTKTKYELKYNENILKPRCNATLGTYIDENIIHDSWQLIDNITSLYPGSDVSGGVFLYPRQALMLSYLVQRDIASRVSASRGKPQTFRVCETGFGSGHSAALFLSLAPNVEVVSFDRYTRPNQNANFFALRSYFGKRLTRVVGDSCKTVKKYAKQCDFLHGSSLCKTDNIDLIQKASSAGVTLTSTAMNSLTDRSVYFGEGAQWSELRGKNCIENILCFREEERALEAKLYLARGKASRISHKFCFAVNTGKCKESKKGPTRSSWHINDFCPEWIIKEDVYA